MTHDPELQDIDNDYQEAIAETLRLGRRRVPSAPPPGELPDLLERLRYPEVRTADQVEFEPYEIQRKN